MKKFLSVLMAAGLVVGFAGAASAAKPESAGPGDNNKKGLCTAYFNGQKNGHTEGEGPGPFGALEDDAADDGTYEDQDVAGETRVASDVFESCDEYGIMGNPEQNGRFDCREGEERDSKPRDTDDSDGDGVTGDGQIECLDNGTETDS